MSFNSNAFMKQQFEPRTAPVSVPSLALFFDDKEEKQEWIVRGQTASEVCRSMEAATNQSKLSSVVEAIAASSNQKDEIKTALGLGSDTPSDIVKRLEQLVCCSVTPEIELPVAVKLAETFPIEFYMLTNKVIELTGLGMDLKKSKTSGKTKK